MSLRAIVFDFDGVIANSEPLHFRAYRDVLAEESIALTERDYYARYLGFDDRGAFRAIGIATGSPMTGTTTSQRGLKPLRRRLGDRQGRQCRYRSMHSVPPPGEPGFRRRGR